MNKLARLAVWKRIILGIIFLVLAALGAIYADFKNYQAKGAFILEYHAIGDHPDWPDYMYIKPEVFERHLQELQRRGLKMITVQELGERLSRGEQVGKYVAMSFDDGYVDDYKNAMPLLKKYGGAGTFSVINTKIGKPGYMDETQIKEMLDQGMEIGCHTSSHNVLTQIDPKYYTWEIATAKYNLEKKISGLVVKTMPYPCGEYNDGVINELKRAGYKQAMTGHTAANTVESYAKNPFDMYRVFIMDEGKQPKLFATLLKRAWLHGYARYHGFDFGD